MGRIDLALTVVGPEKTELAMSVLKDSAMVDVGGDFAMETGKPIQKLAGGTMTAEERSERIQQLRKLYGQLEVEIRKLIPRNNEYDSSLFNAFWHWTLNEVAIIARKIDLIEFGDEIDRNCSSLKNVLAQIRTVFDIFSSSQEAKRWARGEGAFASFQGLMPAYRQPVVDSVLRGEFATDAMAKRFAAVKEEITREHIIAQMEVIADGLIADSAVKDGTVSRAQKAEAGDGAMTAVETSRSDRSRIAWGEKR